MTHTAIYARSATNEPTAPNAVPVQLAKLRTYAAAQGWPVDDAHVFADAGASGATLDRPGLTALRQAVAGGEVKRVIVTDNDRLARDFVLHVQLMDEFAAQECAVVTVTPQRTTATQADAAALAGRLQAAMRV
jgi:site-specific DNA recombinase